MSELSQKDSSVFESKLTVSVKTGEKDRGQSTNSYQAQFPALPDTKTLKLNSVETKGPNSSSSTPKISYNCIDSITKVL